MHGFGFGIVIAIALAVFEFIISPIVFKENRLSVVLVRITTELVFIAAVVYLYYNILGNFHDWSFRSFLGFVFNISVMSIIPVGIILLFYNYRKTKRAYQLLELQPQLTLNEKYVSLESSNKKDAISITINDFLYIEAQDNYISVVYLEKGSIKSKLLRATMKDVEAQLSSEFILRCHRSYIINLNKVSKVIKEGHQLKLYIPELGSPLIASRSYVPNIISILDTRHK